nr:hypothetical protein BaRGS_031352 [Batillaria attramentaria]
MDAESLDIIDSVSEEHIKLMVFEFREANTSVQDHEQKLRFMDNGKLTAFSVVTKEKIPFSSLRQLVRQEDYRWGLIPGTLFESIISTAEDGDGDYERYYQGVLRFAADDPTVLSPNLEVHLAKVVEERYVLLTSSTVYQHLKDKCCRLAMIPERLFTDTIAVHLQKDSPYTRLFDKAIENAKELGLLDYWNRKWFPENTRPCEDFGFN